MSPDETNRLLTRLARSEDPWVERKESFDDHNVRRTLVGFGNSVREGETAVLFIGARNDGKHPAVKDADDYQKKVAGVALKKCYPPIAYRPSFLSVLVGDQQREILAIQVPFSKDGPHFAGVAYMRRGSETVEASREVYLELIASQNDKARRILQFKDKRCWLRLESKSGFWLDFECLVGSCDAHSVTLRGYEDRLWSFPVPSIKVNKAPMRDLEIIAAPRGMEEEFIREIAHRWAGFRKPPAPGEYHLPSDCLVSQILANAALVLPTVAALADSSDNLWLRLLHLHVRFALKKSESSAPRHQKLRRLEACFHENMRGQFPLCNFSVIGAAVHLTVEVATSLTEAEEFLKQLAKVHSGVAQVPYATLRNALLWELKL